MKSCRARSLEVVPEIPRPGRSRSDPARARGSGHVGRLRVPAAGGRGPERPTLCWGGLNLPLQVASGQPRDTLGCSPSARLDRPESSRRLVPAGWSLVVRPSRVAAGGRERRMSAPPRIWPHVRVSRGLRSVVSVARIWTRSPAPRTARIEGVLNEGVSSTLTRTRTAQEPPGSLQGRRDGQMSSASG